MIATLRAALFYVGYTLITIVWGSLSMLIAWLLPYRARFAFIVGCWTRASLWWFKIACGVRWEVSGAKHIPNRPCIIMCRHESTWETLFLQTLFAPQATLLKRELLWIPFFGWAYWLLQPIAIDRSRPRAALRQLIKVGTDRLEEGIWVALFPEGTRMAPGQLGTFQLGGAALAAASAAPVLVVAHNAGDHWPAHNFRKRPGLIRFHIAPPLETAGKSTKQINNEAAHIMAELMASLRPNA